MSRKRLQRGGALSEFALALPFALTLFVGLGDFSIYFWRQTEMEEVARITAARIAPELSRYADADAARLHSFSAVLRDQLRPDSAHPHLSVELTPRYACPLAGGADQEVTLQPRHCPGERVYLRLAIEEPVAPLLLPLRLAGFPQTAFSRHIIRVR